MQVFTNSRFADLNLEAANGEVYTKGIVISGATVNFICTRTF